MTLQSGLRFITGINSCISLKGITHSIPTILNNKLILMHFCSSLNEKDEEKLTGSEFLEHLSTRLKARRHSKSAFLKTESSHLLGL